MGAGKSSCESSEVHETQCNRCCESSDVVEVIDPDTKNADCLATAEQPVGVQEPSQLDGVQEGICHFLLELPELQELPPINIVTGNRAPFTFRTGAVYSGQWKGNERHGFGVHRWPDGASYEGEWIHNVAGGRGRFISADGSIYIGSWKSNQFHGQGVYYSTSLPVYSGEWFQGQRHGFGVEADDELKEAKFMGIFDCDMRSGPGVCRWPDGSEYVGEWQRNDITGRGAYFSTGGDRGYRGQWHESKKHGNGHFLWSDGRSYFGQYDRDDASGFGVFTWADGSKYKGYWRNARQDGHGLYTRPDGSTNSLQWSGGKLLTPEK